MNEGLLLFAQILVLLLENFRGLVLINTVFVLSMTPQFWMSQKLVAIFKIAKNALSCWWLNSSLPGGKILLIKRSYHFRLLIFEGKMFLTLIFLFKSNYLNCGVDEAGAPWPISSIDLHLLSSKQGAFCTYFVDILQALPEIQMYIRCWNKFQSGSKQISKIWATLVLRLVRPVLRLIRLRTVKSVQMPEIFESTTITADIFSQEYRTLMQRA